MMKTLTATLLAILAMLATGTGAAQPEPGKPKSQVLGPLEQKLDSRLIPALNQLRAGTATNASAARDIKMAHGRALASAPNPDEMIVRIDAPVTDALLNAIRESGASVLRATPEWNTVSVRATLSQIDALTKSNALRTITLASRPRVRQQGTTGNQGDSAMRADVARTTFGVSGAKQKIGVISDSVTDTSAVSGTGKVVTGSVPNAVVTGTVPQKSGDLPPSFQVVDFGVGGGSDEGERMMEVIYDVAPGAGLAFGAVGNIQTDLAANLLALRTQAGCTITVDDIAFLDEPFFQDGPIAQAIRTNYNAGVPHFSAFGNDGTAGVLATYAAVNSTTDDGLDPPSGNCFHNWGSGTATPGFLPIHMTSGTDLTVILQWNQPFQSFNLGSGSRADLDLYLYSSPAVGIPLASSVGHQGNAVSPQGDPVEILDYVNNGPDTTVYLAINHFQGVRNNVMRLVLEEVHGTLSFPSGGVGGMTGFGHPTSPECIGVGAIDWQNIQNNVLKPESFSSQGGIGSAGIPYYFDSSGNPLPNAPVLRSAPDLAAPDGVSTSLDASGFFGTSCAAPNAAAAAALVLELTPTLSPANLLATLKGSARDATVAPASAGVDAFTGAGLVDAYAALASSMAPPVITSPTTAHGNVGRAFSYTITASGGGNMIFGATSLPPGLSLNGAVISGTPTQAATSSVSLSAKNALGSASQTLTLAIGDRVPIQITVAPAASPNPVAVGVAATFTVSAQTDLNETLNYSWNFGDGTTASGTPVTHSFAAPTRYIVAVTVTDVSDAPAKATVAVDVTPLPTITSAASAAPNPAGVGQTVSFSAAASGGTGTLNYSWDFGDGQSASDASTTHSYVAAGAYTAVITATDSGGGTVQSSVTVNVNAPLVGKGFDSDGDGFSDSFEAVAGTDPNSASSTPMNGAPASSFTFQALSISKLVIKLNFVRAGNDGISFSGTLPFAAGFNPAGQAVVIDISGVDAKFVLAGRGTSARSAKGSLKLQFKSAKGVTLAQQAKFSVALSRGNFADKLAPFGLTDSAFNAPVNIDVQVLFNGALYQTTAALKYNATNGRSGVAK
ncbi:MAG TPA: PKD domain-containing protein [Planctomycetota bacterium]|jgi:PKD repeat protein